MTGYEPYSPQLRTALLLTGTGTAGAYHAGVLRALGEAGVKLDVVAGRGIGVVGALFAAIDAAQRLWDEKGLWRRGAVRSFYAWRVAVRVVVLALAVSVGIVLLPLAVMAAGLIVFPVDFILKVVGAGGSAGLVAEYLRLAERVFAPEALPTWLPRLVLLVLGVAALVAGVDGWMRTRGRQSGAWWWRVAGAPLDAGSVAAEVWQVMWDQVRGAASLKEPAVAELGRRYLELLAENQGQPGFRELLVTAHDLDARRDLVFALVGEPRRRDLFRRVTDEAADARRAEILDLAGIGREYLADAVAGALAVPIASEPHRMVFAPEAFWRGETHRLVDRPSAIFRLLDELVELGVEQIVIVSAAPAAGRPHALAGARLEPRARLGEVLQSAEAAAVNDATRAVAPGLPRVFTIRPEHNPVGPFDFAGGYDDRSDRRQPLDELLGRGYEDAYRQFIEPVVGASGDQVGGADVTRRAGGERSVLAEPEPGRWT